MRGSAAPSLEEIILRRLAVAARRLLLVTGVGGAIGLGGWLSTERAAPAGAEVLTARLGALVVRLPETRPAAVRAPARVHLRDAGADAADEPR